MNKDQKLEKELKKEIRDIKEHFRSTKELVDLIVKTSRKQYGDIGTNIREANKYSDETRLKKLEARLKKLQEKYKPDFRWDYDRENDVMYISFGEPQRCINEETSPGMVIRRNRKKLLNGITIINYSHNTTDKVSYKK